MRYIMIAAGNQTRWNNYLGVSKHFVEIEGERLIERTVRLIREREKGAKIFIVGNNDDYQIEGAELYIPTINLENGDADKFLSSLDLWKNFTFTIVYGDVYFTEEAMDKICSSLLDEWRAYGRFDKSEITGCEWGEIFAFSFKDSFSDKVLRALHYLVKIYREKKISRNSGWELYRYLEGFPLTRHLKGWHFCEIDDFTEDFDFPQDYDRWIAARKEYLKNV